MLNVQLLALSGGRVRNTSASPVAFNGGTPTNAAGVLCTSSSVPQVSLGGLGYLNNGALSVALGGTPVYFAGGIPVAADGRTCVEAAVATKYSAGGIPLTATGRVALATAELVFLDEMSVSHILTVGINPGGNRVGYRRGEWGDFQPNDVPSLSRLFTNLSNNRLVVQADGDMSTLVISNIHIHRISNGANFNFGAPSSVLFDGVVTDFTWIVPFDFVLGEQYTVSLS